ADSKTGFREFEEQRDKSMQIGNSVDKETKPNTTRSSSYELEMLDDRKMNNSKVSDSQSPPTEKLHEDLAIDFEENHRLRGSLEVAEVGLSSLAKEDALSSYHHLKVVYVPSTPSPVWSENETLEMTRKRMKWENDDYICRGHILNGMSDSLFDIYQNAESAKTLCVEY
ncbi:hypothetical protein Tco_1190944, partial [Tanacetum coccineum]